jgi:hypothetical protein
MSGSVYPSGSVTESEYEDLLEALDIKGANDGISIGNAIQEGYNYLGWTVDTVYMWKNDTTGSSTPSPRSSPSPTRSSTPSPPSSPSPSAPRVRSTGLWVRRKMQAYMGSAILCTNPGADTGEMLFAYPSTGIRTDQEKETMKCTLRVYLGAAIYREDCLLKLPHVSFEGIKSGGGGVNDLEEMRGTETLDRITNTIKLDDGSTAYEGAVWIQKAGGSAGWELYTKNSGHLGVLDDPDATDRLHGMHKFDTSSYKP